MDALLGDALLGDGRVGRWAMGATDEGCPLRQNQQSISVSPSDKNHVLRATKLSKLGKHDSYISIA